MNQERSVASSKPIGERAEATDIRRSVSGLSIDRKASLCSGVDMWKTETVSELGLKAVVMTDGPHGLRMQDPNASSFISAYPATCFPTAAGLAASWDPDLARQIGEVIGLEARAQGVGVVLGPGANIKRHPLCGRNFEYFSEDPMLTGEMAAAMIIGLQSVGVGASLKHFAVNNQETRRMVVDAVIDDRALREIYLAGFEIAVRKANPWTVMCAYNRINGEHCADNRWLLSEVLRDDWGFDGAVVSDWGAVNDRVGGVRAGLDLEMPGGDGLNDSLIAQAVRDGKLAQEQLDLAAGRVRRLIERAAPTDDTKQHDAPTHHALARRAAAESAVLLRNDGILPLKTKGTLAVVGAFASEPRYQGAGSSQVTPTQLDKPLDSITALVGVSGASNTVSYAPGYEATTDALRADLIAEAVEVAHQADNVVLFAGLPRPYESEGFDRDHLRLPPQHNSLINAVVAANPNTVVVLCNGSPVEMPWVDEPRAIIEAYLGGQGFGAGIADVLFGVVNPSAKLAETFPLTQGDLAADPWFPGTGRKVEYREGVYVGYRWTETANTEVLFPFGHGLSYTTFDYSDFEVSAGADRETTATASVTITNTGDLAGAEVVQLYVRQRAVGIDRPDRELKAFDKVFLQPGESHTTSFALGPRAFSFYDIASSQWQIDEGDFEILVGASVRDIRATGVVSIGSDLRRVGAPAISENLMPDLTSDRDFTRRLGRPIPQAEPERPFHRGSTIEEIGAVWIGRKFGQLVERNGAKQFGEADEALKTMIKRGTAEAPLRVISQLTSGQLSMANVDRLLWLCNHWPSRRHKTRSHSGP